MGHWANETKGSVVHENTDRIRNAEGDIFEDIFARSWELLSDKSRHVLLVLATFNGPVSEETLRLAMGMQNSDFEEAVGQLIEMWLVEPHWLPKTDITNYDIIYLTRVFAFDVMRKNPDLALRSKNAVIFWTLDKIRMYGDNSWEEYDWNWERYSFLDSDLENLLGGLDLAFEGERWKEHLQMIKGLIHYFGVRGLLNERISRSHQGLRAAQQTHDVEAEAWLYVAGFGWTYMQQGLLDSALAVVQAGCKIAEQYAIQNCIAEAYRHLGVISLEHQNFSDAELKLSNALEVAKIPRIQARIHSDLGRLAEKKMDYQHAKAEYQSSLEISLQANDYWGKFVTPLYLAELEFTKPDYIEAKKYYEQALILGESILAYWIIAEAQFGLAGIEVEQRHFSNRANY